MKTKKPAKLAGFFCFFPMAVYDRLTTLKKWSDVVYPLLGGVQF
jgi:hypothetical protein